MKSNEFRLGFLKLMNAVLKVARRLLSVWENFHICDFGLFAVSSREVEGSLENQQENFIRYRPVKFSEEKWDR